MKKFIALALFASSALLAGCGNDYKIYDCGDEVFKVSSSEMISVRTGAVIEQYKEPGRYRLFSTIGTANYWVDGNEIKVSFAQYSNKLTCEVSDK